MYVYYANNIYFRPMNLNAVLEYLEELDNLHATLTICHLMLVVRDGSNLGNCAGSVADFVAGLWRICGGFCGGSNRGS